MFFERAFHLAGSCVEHAVVDRIGGVAATQGDVDGDLSDRSRPVVSLCQVAGVDGKQVVSGDPHPAERLDRLPGEEVSFAGFRMEWSLSPSGNTSTSGKRLRRRSATVRATAPVPKKSIDSHPATGMMYRAASDGAAEAWRIIHAPAPTNRKQPASRGRILRRLRWKRRGSGAAVMMFGVEGYPKICKKRNKRKFGVQTSWQ